MAKDEFKNFFDKFSSYMEEDSRGVEVLTYGIAGVGLITALYKIRPFARFTSPYNVPKSFIKKKVHLEGVVRHVEPALQPYIFVDHKPLIPLPRFGKQKYLPIKAAGVDVTGNGISWLQSVVQGKKIEFIPVNRYSDYLSCIIMIPQEKEEPIHLAQELVKLGFGTVQNFQEIIPSDKDIKIYKNSLKLAQNWAERRRNGVWQFKTPPTLIWKVRNKIDDKLRSVLPEPISKYFNI